MDQRQFDKDMALFQREKKVGYKYLASPYSAKLANKSPDLDTMKARFEKVMDATATLMTDNQDLFIYSPIVHCHEMAIKYVLPKDYAFWGAYNRCMIAQADEFWLLALPGWEDSIGCKAEWSFARNQDIPCFLVDPVTLKRTPLEAWDDNK